MNRKEKNIIKNTYQEKLHQLMRTTNKDFKDQYKIELQAYRQLLKVLGVEYIANQVEIQQLRGCSHINNIIAVAENVNIGVTDLGLFKLVDYFVEVYQYKASSSNEDFNKIAIANLSLLKTIIEQNQELLISINTEYNSLLEYITDNIELLQLERGI